MICLIVCNVQLRCGEIWTFPGPVGTWNNQDCTYRRGYVCQTYKGMSFMSEILICIVNVPHDYLELQRLQTLVSWSSRLMPVCLQADWILIRLIRIFGMIFSVTGGNLFGFVIFLSTPLRLCPLSRRVPEVIGVKRSDVPHLIPSVPAIVYCIKY